ALPIYELVRAVLAPLALVDRGLERTVGVPVGQDVELETGQVGGRGDRVLTAVQRVGHGRFVLSCGGRLGGAASCRDDAPRWGTPRYHPSCRCSLARASTASFGFDGPTCLVLLTNSFGFPFFLMLTGDGRVY